MVERPSKYILETMASAGTKRREIINGVRSAGIVLLFVAWLVLLFAGLAIAFSPSKFPRVFGWVLLAAASGLLVTFADKWIRAFPGILAVGIINSFVTIFSGHLTNRPSTPIGKSAAVGTTLFLITSFVLSIPLSRRQLDWWDRMTLLIYTACVSWQVVDGSRLILACSVALLTLLLNQGFHYKTNER